MATARQSVSGQLLVTPDPFVPNFQLLIKRCSNGVTGVYSSSDGGKTWKIFLPVPGSSISAGAVLTLQSDGTVAWTLPSVPVSSISKKTPIYTEMLQVGSLAAGQSFGYFKVSSGLNLTLTEIQLYVQNSANTPITVDVVNGSNVQQGRLATIRASAQSNSTVLQSPLLMPAGTVWGMTVIAAGSGGTPGQNLTARLVLSAT